MPTVHGPRGAVATADRLATEAGVSILAEGGNAVDAAIAANAVLAVTAPHLCGMGGDLFAIVRSDDGEVACLNASGRAGSGADPAAMRAEGLREMPLRHDIRSVTVPGCVDGWVALHRRFGSMPLDGLFTPAVQLATDGFPASPLLVGTVGRLDVAGRARLDEIVAQAASPGAVVRRPGVARVLGAVAADGRDGFYRGEFGDGLLASGAGVFTASDLARHQATWVAPLRVRVWDHDLWTVPPNSQGYLVLGAALLAERIGLPESADDPVWAHRLIECATAAGFDRPAMLHESADGAALVERIARRADSIDRERATRRPVAGAAGDTTYLCTADADGTVVSLIQSNASDFGTWLVEPSTGINLHSRGLGFNLQPGHPAELRRGARPPHTLSPALVTGRDGWAAAVGTMGGDAQPQIVLQLVARLLHHGSDAGAAVDAGRWVLHGPETGFDTWSAPDGPEVWVEESAPPDWVDDLAGRGHRVNRRRTEQGGFGHAHIVAGSADHGWQAAADPRAVVGAAIAR